MSQQTDGTLLFRRSQLIITWPDNTQETYTIKQNSIRIGRGDLGNDIPVPASFNSISRKHLEIQRSAAGFHVVDLGSRNGFMVNGELVDGSTIIQDGDEIRLGSSNLGQHLRIVFQAGVGLTVGDMAESPGEESPVTVEGFLQNAPREAPFLKLTWPDGSRNFFAITTPAITLGRASDCSLRFPSNLRFISNRHAEIRKTDQGYTITDLESSNGTLVNNHALEPHQPVRLVDESVIRIGDSSFGISIGLTFNNPQEAQFKASGFSPSQVGPTMITPQSQILIGRDDTCDMVLASPQVSRKHALIRQIGDAAYIEDLGSTNGTFLNQLPVTRSQIQDGDLITIGSQMLVFQSGQISQYKSMGMRLDVSDLSKDIKIRGGKLRILHNIDMTILPREFISIVGGSGAGKSTLMNALIGFRPGEGEITLNGHDFYKEYEHYRALLGYVPQSDILHTTLTVEKALDYASKLRLPSDISADERQSRIGAVLDTVSMNTETIRKTRIGNLSGGQRKRVSIAAELLADPKLIFLDEATSGLDPGLEKKMMYTLRRMADEGRTVILITHATANIVQTDHVAFLSQGKLVYFGPSQEALEFFDVDDFADIYERIERHGEKWEQTFRQENPAHYQQYVLERQESRPLASERDLPKMRFSLLDSLRQFTVLTRRAVNVLMSDWFTLILMLLLFPLTATLQLIISSPDILVGDLSILADPVAAAKSMTESYIPFANLNTFIFVMGLEAVLVGMYVPSNELIKERTIYLRERMVNLKVLPYLFSKVAVFTAFAAIQTFLYLVVLSIGVDLPEDGLLLPAPIELFITLFLTMLAGMGIGFVVSAVSRSSDMAIYVLVILLFYQFFFAGTVFDMRDNFAEPLSYTTTTRWALTALGVTIDMEEQVEATIICNDLPEEMRRPGMPEGEKICFNYPEATEDLMLPYDDDKLVQSWLILIGMTLITLTVSGILIKRLDN